MYQTHVLFFDIQHRCMYTQQWFKPCLCNTSNSAYLISSMFGSWKKLNHYLFMKATYWFVCNDHISKLQTFNVILVHFLDISFKGNEFSNINQIIFILIEIICIPRLCIDKNINSINLFCLSISRINLCFEYPFCKWIKGILMICSKPRQTLLNLTTDGLEFGSWCGFEINDLRYCNNCNVASLSNLH